jgi:hypothetical protein
MLTLDRADGQGLHRGLDLAIAIKQGVRVIVVQLVAAFLAFNRNPKRGIRQDVHAIDWIHLNGNPHLRPSAAELVTGCAF